MMDSSRNLPNNASSATKLVTTGQTQTGPPGLNIIGSQPIDNLLQSRLVLQNQNQNITNINNDLIGTGIQSTSGSLAFFPSATTSPQPSEVVGIPINVASLASRSKQNLLNQNQNSNSSSNLTNQQQNFNPVSRNSIPSMIDNQNLQQNTDSINQNLVTSSMNNLVKNSYGSGLIGNSAVNLSNYISQAVAKTHTSALTAKVVTASQSPSDAAAQQQQSQQSGTGSSSMIQNQSPRTKYTTSTGQSVQPTEPALVASPLTGPLNETVGFTAKRLVQNHSNSNLIALSSSNSSNQNLNYTANNATVSNQVQDIQNLQNSKQFQRQNIDLQAKPTASDSAAFNSVTAASTTLYHNFASSYAPQNNLTMGSSSSSSRPNLGVFGEDLLLADEAESALYLDISTMGSLGGSAAYVNVGMERSMTALSDEFQHNENLKGQCLSLQSIFRGFRSIRGDGNCYYRALLCGLFEFAVHQDRPTLFSQLHRQFGACLTRNSKTQSSSDSDDFDNRFGQQQADQEQVFEVQTAQRYLREWRKRLLRIRHLKAFMDFRRFRDGDDLISEISSETGNQSASQQFKNQINRQQQQWLSQVQSAKTYRTCLVEEIFHLLNSIPELDFALVKCLRRLIGRFLLENRKLDTTDSGLTLEEWVMALGLPSMDHFVEQNVLRMGEDASDLTQFVAPRALGMLVRIVMMERSSKDFICLDNGPNVGKSDSNQSNLANQTTNSKSSDIQIEQTQQQLLKSTSQTSTVSESLLQSVKALKSKEDLDSNQQQDFVGQTQESEPSIFLLFKPGHYDILVPYDDDELRQIQAQQKQMEFQSGDQGQCHLSGGTGPFDAEALINQDTKTIGAGLDNHKVDSGSEVKRHFLQNAQPIVNTSKSESLNVHDSIENVNKDIVIPMPSESLQSVTPSSRKLYLNNLGNRSTQHSGDQVAQDPEVTGASSKESTTSENIKISQKSKTQRGTLNNRKVMPVLLDALSLLEERILQDYSGWTEDSHTMFEVQLRSLAELIDESVSAPLDKPILMKLRRCFGVDLPSQSDTLKSPQTPTLSHSVLTTQVPQTQESNSNVNLNATTASGKAAQSYTIPQELADNQNLNSISRGSSGQAQTSTSQSVESSPKSSKVISKETNRKDSSTNVEVTVNSTSNCTANSNTATVTSNLSSTGGYLKALLRGKQDTQAAQGSTTIQSATSPKTASPAANSPKQPVVTPAGISTAASSDQEKDKENSSNVNVVVTVDSNTNSNLNQTTVDQQQTQQAVLNSTDPIPGQNLRTRQRPDWCAPRAGSRSNLVKIKSDGRTGSESHSPKSPKDRSANSSSGSLVDLGTAANQDQIGPFDHVSEIQQQLTSTGTSGFDQSSLKPPATRKILITPKELPQCAFCLEDIVAGSRMVRSISCSCTFHQECFGLYQAMSVDLNPDVNLKCHLHDIPIVSERAVCVVGAQDPPGQQYSGATSIGKPIYNSTVGQGNGAVNIDSNNTSLAAVDNQNLQSTEKSQVTAMSSATANISDSGPGTVASTESTVTVTSTSTTNKKRSILKDIEENFQAWKRKQQQQQQVSQTASTVTTSQTTVGSGKPIHTTGRPGDERTVKDLRKLILQQEETQSQIANLKNQTAKTVQKQSNNPFAITKKNKENERVPVTTVDSSSTTVDIGGTTTTANQPHSNSTVALSNLPCVICFDMHSKENPMLLLSCCNLGVHYSCLTTYWKNQCVSKMQFCSQLSCPASLNAGCEAKIQIKDLFVEKRNLQNNYVHDVTLSQSGPGPQPGVATQQSQTNSTVSKLKSSKSLTGSSSWLGGLQGRIMGSIARIEKENNATIQQAIASQQVSQSISQSDSHGNVNAASQINMDSFQQTELEFECPICFISHPIEGSCTLPCGHRFCFQSLQHHFTILVKERRLNHLHCPLEDCKFNLRNQEHMPIFQECLHPPVYEKLLEFLARDDPRIVECPKCQDQLFVDEAAGDSFTSLRCLSCGHFYCGKCFQAPHPDVVGPNAQSSCEYAAEKKALQDLEKQEKNKSVQQDQNSKATEETIKTVLASGFKPCPSLCQYGGGSKLDDSECDHVSCRCGLEFCWNCGVDRRILLAHDNRWHKPNCIYHTKPSEVSEKPRYSADCPACVQNKGVCSFPIDDGYPESYMAKISTRIGQ